MALRVPMLCEWSMLPTSGRVSVVGTKLSCCISVFIATNCIDVGQSSHLALGSRALTNEVTGLGTQAGVRGLAWHCKVPSSIFST